MRRGTCAAWAFIAATGIAACSTLGDDPFPDAPDAAPIDARVPVDAGPTDAAPIDATLDAGPVDAALDASGVDATPTADASAAD